MFGGVENRLAQVLFGIPAVKGVEFGDEIFIGSEYNDSFICTDGKIHTQTNHCGGILGGICISRGGLKRWLWPMVWAISLPDIVYVYLSYAQTASLPVISACLFIEQFGYGFGFTAYMLFLIYYARGTHETAHYAIATAFMAAGMMLPGMMAGALQEWMGYRGFFIWVMACCAVTFAVSAFLKIEDGFGKK